MILKLFYLVFTKNMFISKWKIYFFTVAIVGISLQGCSRNINPNISSKIQNKQLECVAPARPGGGLDLTCQLLANSLQKSNLIKQPIHLEYLPGGIGAVAYKEIAATRTEDGNVIVAASKGSALNLAQGKFGEYDENAVRWLAALGVDYGVIVVKADSPWQNLQDLMEALKKDPNSIVFGASGSIGSQDWMKVALLAKAAGTNPRKIRFVPHEGGGEALVSVLDGQTQVCPCDFSEIREEIETGRYKILAILADERIKGEFGKYPTAKEQGYDVTWAIWRGYYVSLNIDQAEYQWWTNIMTKLVKTPEFKQELANKGLFPYTKIGSEYEVMVKQQVKDFRQLVEEVGLN